jgi:hypothetical protein
MAQVSSHQNKEVVPKKVMVHKKDENYVPKLHTDMPDWKKILYYTKVILPQYPRLDGKPVDTTTEAYKCLAIAHVNGLLREEKKTYEQRVARREKKEKEREEKERKRKEQERLREQLHVEEMKKKYGHSWYWDVEKNEEEDCQEAANLRYEEEREDEMRYWNEEQERMWIEKEFEEEHDREEHEEQFFNTRMEIELRSVSPEKRQKHIERARAKMETEKWERELQSDWEFEEEGIQWSRHHEAMLEEQEKKKKRIAAYEAAKKG